MASSLAVSACAADSDGGPQAQGRTVHRSPHSAGSPAESSLEPTTEAPREAPGASCLRPADQARLVHFGPDQGLGGYLVGGGRRYVVLAHELGGDSCQMLPLAQRLAAAGFRAFAFDSAGVLSSAASDREGHQVADDVLAAVGWARAHGATDIALVGASKGGYGVLDAGTRAAPPVDAVVSLSAPSAWDEPTGKPLDISDLTSPTQLWAARQDVGFSAAARGFAKQDASAELYLEPGAAHGVALVPVAFAQIRDFLDAHLR